MNPRTITGTLIVVVIALQMISFIAVNRQTHTRLHEQAQLLSVHELENKAKSLLIQAQQFLTPIPSQLSISRQLVADNLLDAADSSTLESYFVSQLRSNLSMNAMYLGRSDGSYVAVGRFERSLIADYHNPVLRARVVSMSGQQAPKISWREYSLRGQELNAWQDEADAVDPRVREWYEYAHTYDQPVWTNAFSLSNSGRRAIAASVNLRDHKGKDAGVLGVSVDLDQLTEMISRIPMSRLTSAYILDNELNLIAGSIPSSLNVDEATAGDGSTLSTSQIPVTTLPRELLPPIDVEGNRLSAVDRDWFSKSGKQANVQRRIQMFDGALQWRVVLNTPVSVIEDRHKGVLREGLLYSVSIIVFPGLLALLFILGLAKPLGRLHRRATVDYLTRAFNREEFINRFGKRLEKNRQSRQSPDRWVGVVLDLDGFKKINDEHGHDAGDVILKTVVSRLRHIVGRDGFIGRMGGDEFAIALKLKPEVDAQSAVDRIRRDVVNESIRSGSAIHTIGMTAGIAEATPHERVEQILELADRALIAGKTIGKNASYSTESLSALYDNVIVPLNPNRRIAETPLITKAIIGA